MNRRNFFAAIAAPFIARLARPLPDGKHQYMVSVDPADPRSDTTVVSERIYWHKGINCLEIWGPGLHTVTVTSGGYFIYKGDPMIYWHGQPPFVQVNTGQNPWKRA